MNLVAEFGAALMMALGVLLAALLIFLAYRLISLAVHARRDSVRRDAAARAEAKLVTRLRADGYSPADATAAVEETRQSP